MRPILLALLDRLSRAHFVVAGLSTFLFTASLNAADASAGSRVKFDSNGIALVDDKPFFPLGIFTYELNSDVLAEIHELQCNTILHGFNPNQLDLIQQHGLMAVCPAESSWLAAARKHPALLAWYLSDEPENRSVPPAELHTAYLDLKKSDPDHPIGVCHTSFEALTQFKDACDFTMTDIYPISSKRDKNVMGVSIMMDEARRIHGQAWPQWTYIQAFGGPETDNGVWAVPLPHEVRFMTYQALVHRATGILYFSYWPKQPRTWQSIAGLNREIQQLVPWLLAPGKEEAASASSPEVQVRVRSLSVGSKRSGLAIAINTSPRFVQADIPLPSASGTVLAPFEGRSVELSTDGKLAERFSSYGVHIYTWGPEPVVALAGEQGKAK